MQMHSPLHQFEVTPVLVLPQLFGYDVSITNSSMFMIISVVAVMLFFAVATAKKAMVPGRLQSLAEIIYQFIENMLGETAGEKAKKFFPFFLTLFLFILFMNLLGMVPYSFTPTSHLIVTFTLAILVFLGVTITGMVHQGPINFLKHFAPEGMPFILLPLIVIIEIVSYLARPFSLSIRLAANMMAGHTLTKVVAGFVFPLGLIAGIAPLLFLVALTGFEIFVAILQAYVFALLSTIYLSEALADNTHH